MRDKNLRFIYGIFLCFYAICAYPSDTVEQTYYVYKIDGAIPKYDFTTNVDEVGANSEIVFQSPIMKDSITGGEYAIDNCILLYGVANLDSLIYAAQLADFILSIDTISWVPMIYEVHTHSLSCFQLDSLCGRLDDSEYCEIAEVDYAYFNSIYDIHPEQNPQYESKQWYLSSSSNTCSINVAGAWLYSTGDNITVAIVDEGIDIDHQDLKGNLIQGYDCTDGLDGYKYGSCNFDSDSAEHGTLCAGLIGATNDSIGMIGIAPNCKMMPIRVSRHKKNDLNKFYGKTSWYIKGLKKAYEVGADIVNCSWSFTHITKRKRKLMDKILDTLTQDGRNGLGSIVVCSVGNNSYEKIMYPSTHDGVIAVGAIASSGYLANMSNYGKGIDLVAPGEEIYTTNKKKKRLSDGTYIENLYITAKGTSVACPMVAGVAALILADNPDICRDSVETILKRTAHRIPKYSFAQEISTDCGGWNPKVGHGLVDAYAAIIEVNKEYIQNIQYSSGDVKKELGTFVYVGDSVTSKKSYGDVIVNSGSDLLLQATKEIRFTDGFHAKAGSNMIAQIVPESEWKNLSSARRSSMRFNAPKNNNQSSTENEESISQNFDNGIECSNVTITCTNVYSLSGFLLQTFEGEICTLSHLPDGMYILQHRMSDGSTRIEKIANNK